MEKELVLTKEELNGNFNEYVIKEVNSFINRIKNESCYQKQSTYFNSSKLVVSSIYEYLKEHTDLDVKQESTDGLSITVEW